MLRFRAWPSWRSLRFASRLSQSPADGQLSSMKTTATTPGSGNKLTSILSRLSDKTQSAIHRISGAEQKSSAAPAQAAPALHRKPRPRATSFISARSAQQRDQATEKWFTDVRKLDIDNVNQRDDLKTLPRQKRMGSEHPKQHEMRPRTDLNALFAPPTFRAATSLRLQTMRELGGDYASYLPSGYADPYRLPIDYARLVLGRNKHIPLDAQTGALSVVEEAIRGRTSRQDRAVT